MAEKMKWVKSGCKLEKGARQFQNQSERGKHRQGGGGRKATQKEPEMD